MIPRAVPAGGQIQVVRLAGLTILGRSAGEGSDRTGPGFQLTVKSNSRFLIFGFVLLRSVHG